MTDMSSFRDHTALRDGVECADRLLAGSVRHISLAITTRDMLVFWVSIDFGDQTSGHESSRMRLDKLVVLRS